MTVSMIPLQPILLVLAIGLVPSTAVALEIKGPVVSILDGDTIEVLHHTRAERIRLNGIDSLAMRAPRNVVDSTRRP